MMFFTLLFGIVLIGAIVFYFLMPKVEPLPQTQRLEGTITVTPEPRGKEGSLADLPDYIAGLLEAVAGTDGSDKFLIGIVSETDNFLQFTAYDNEVEIDFPLLADQQKAFEEKFMAACKKAGVEPAPYNHPNPDKIGSAYGDDFLDYVIRGSAEEISKTITEIYINTFEIDTTTAMNFEKNGF